jgi:hypothetical protein
MNFTDVLDDLVDAVKRGGDSSRWLGNAYCSWYRGTPEISLSGFGSLDAKNRQLFVQMLQLRHYKGWSDEALFVYEQTIKAMLVPVTD